MQDIVSSMLFNTGKIRRDVEAKFFGKQYPSRGFYICDNGGRWYLHHDGLVKDGVKADSEKPAFWPSEKEAQDFFDAWKKDRA